MSQRFSRVEAGWMITRCLRAKVHTKTQRFRHSPLVMIQLFHRPKEHPILLMLRSVIMFDTSVTMSCWRKSPEAAWAWYSKHAK